MERFTRSLHRPFQVAGRELELEFSIGAVLFGTDGSSYQIDVDEPDDLLRLADEALYNTKENPGYSLNLFTKAEHDESRRDTGLLEREQELRRALGEEEFGVHLQPIVHLATCEIQALEALARWHHPERGVVGPREFIFLAEEMGLIEELGGRLATKALRVGSRLSARDGTSKVPITLNVSSQQLDDPDFAASVERIAEQVGVDLNRVVIEVTESSLMEATRSVDEIRELGVRVFIDDFGTGYSSFHHLRDLNADGLKIDMSFVQGLEERTSNAAIIETISLLGEKLGITIIAEGIETRKQRDRLLDLGCELGQGYLFGRPEAVDTMIGRIGQDGIIAPRAVP